MRIPLAGAVRALHVRHGIGEPRGPRARRTSGPRTRSTPYRQVLAIQERFLDGSFFYTLDVEPASDADALLDFLTTRGAGSASSSRRRWRSWSASSATPPASPWASAPAPSATGASSCRPRRPTPGSRSSSPAYGWLAVRADADPINPLAEAGHLPEPAPRRPGRKAPRGRVSRARTASGGGRRSGEACLGPDAAARSRVSCATPRRDPSAAGTPDGPAARVPGRARSRRRRRTGTPIPYGLILLVAAGGRRAAPAGRAPGQVGLAAPRAPPFDGAPRAGPRRVPRVRRRGGRPRPRAA